MWPLAFFLATVTHGAVPESVASHAWYRFEDAADLAKNVGTHPLPASLPAHGVKQIPGPIGQALELDGHRGHGLKIPDPHLIFGREAVSGTVMLWVRPSFDVATDTREQVLFNFTPRAGNTRVDGYEIVAVMTGEKFRVQPQIRPSIRMKTPLKRDKWTHLALTWHVERGAAFYVDGKRAGGFKNRFKPVKLGRFAGWIGHHGTCGRPFHGVIDEVHLFDRMLSDQEVAALVKADPGPRIKVLRWQDGSAEIVNTGDRPKHVWIREYREVEPVLTAGNARSIPPNGQAVVPPPRNPPTLGSRRLGVMVGSGDTAVECAHETYAGLQWRLEPRKRVFFSDELVVLGLAITNDTGSRYDGALIAGLTDWDGSPLPSHPPKPVKAEQGQSVSIGWEISDPLAIDAYHLTISAARPDGEAEALGSVNLVSTKRETYRDIFTVATTFHRGKEDVWLRAKADGATVFRWGAGYRPDLRYHEELTDTLGRIGCENYVNVHPIRGCPVDRSLPGVQGTARYVCLSHPEVHEAIRGMAEIVAKYYRHNPITPVVFVEGELPCHAADYAEANTRAFRAWLRERYRSLDALNREWSKQYQSWDEIEQIGSPRDVDAAAHSKMWMTRELPKKTTTRFKALAKMDPTRAIEWRRWHQSVIDHAYL
nr:beta-galactosidase [PVC group bacterium]